MKKGVIYILTNPSFPEYIKIGYAQDLQKRLRQLNRSGSIPFKFSAYAMYEIEGELTDQELRDLIDTLNPNLEAADGKERQKEFYAMSAESAYKLLECVAKISGTSKNLKRTEADGTIILDEQKTVDDSIETRKKGPFRFSEYGIPVGAEIEFIDDPSIHAKVVDDRHIEYLGETTSCSALVKKLKGFDYPVQGTQWFTYNGKRLTDIRSELEEKHLKA